MKTSNSSSRVQYAIIKVRESDGRVERLVIGYPDERTLRQLLAKPSIVATGFFTRDEATKESLTHGARILPGCSRLHRLTMRRLIRFRCRVGAPQVIKSVVHTARTVLDKIQSRFKHGRRRLQVAVP